MKTFLKIDHYIERLTQSSRVFLITFVLAFLEQSISPVLPEAYTAVILSYRKDLSWKKLSIISSCGSLGGALFTYGLGYFFYDVFGKELLSFFGMTGVFMKAQELFGNAVFMTQFVATLSPLPDRVFSFAGGAFQVSVIGIACATMIGRLVRALVLNYLAYEFGDEARDMIKKHTKLATSITIIAVVFYCVYSAFLA